ncbi:hypothetical protein D3877_10125 [Azospirillum cavernae]|uniref:Uncharacterized protein n=1 Tax=Azospirillum cavernae TaxID=2320860 RepID=A0A418W493_9PROT|nr:hypothetical protein [Azospirillum cavernae]RJF84826.1 hypothetical protein D3877_10125 [Azospirillum cavernae]
MNSMGDNGQALPGLSQSDIDTTINGEPRILDLRLAEALGFKRSADIRPLIERHREALERLGGIFRTVRKNPGRGRPAAEFWLTKKQAIYIATKAETERATEITIQIVEVFDTVTSGRASPPPVPALTKADLDRIDERARMAAALEETRVRNTLTGAALDALRRGQPIQPVIQGGRRRPQLTARPQIRSRLSPPTWAPGFLALPVDVQIALERATELMVEINRVMAELWDVTGKADVRDQIGEILSVKTTQWRAGAPHFTSH